MTWGHWNLGLLHAARADARDSLRTFRAVDTARNADGHAKRDWMEAHAMIAGWHGRARGQ